MASKSPTVDVIRVVEVIGPRGGVMHAHVLACGHSIYQRKARTRMPCWMCAVATELANG